MTLFNLISRNPVSASIVAVVVIVALGFVFVPLTRNYVDTDAFCNYCHVWSGIGEYDTDARFTVSKPHGLDEEKEVAPTRCVDCHVPQGFAGAVYSYTHFISVTDLFGHFRDRDGERAGEWIPPGAARAYRVRDRLLENDSITCRGCHVESEIVPKRERGKTAHEEALRDKETCISCHNNLVHREVAVRELKSKDETIEADGLEDDLDDGLIDDLEDDSDDDDLEDL